MKKIWQIVFILVFLFNLKVYSQQNREQTISCEYFKVKLENIFNESFNNPNDYLIFIITRGNKKDSNLRVSRLMKNFIKDGVKFNKIKEEKLVIIENSKQRKNDGQVDIYIGSIKESYSFNITTLDCP